MRLGTATATFHILLVAAKPLFAPFTDATLEAEESWSQRNLVSVNCLEKPQISQESLEIEDGEIVEV